MSTVTTRPFRSFRIRSGSLSQRKLVPGVEIFPYINVLKPPFLGDAMLNLGGTTASLGIDKERIAFSNPYNAGKLAPIICYESIYGEFVTDYV